MLYKNVQANTPTFKPNSHPKHQKRYNRLSGLQHHHICFKGNHISLDSLKRLLAQQIFSAKTLKYDATFTFSQELAYQTLSCTTDH